MTHIFASQESDYFRSSSFLSYVSMVTHFNLTYCNLQYHRFRPSPNPIFCAYWLPDNVPMVLCLKWSIRRILGNANETYIASKRMAVFHHTSPLPTSRFNKDASKSFLSMPFLNSGY